MRPADAAVILLFVAAGCGTTSERRVPERLVEAPDLEREADRESWRARQLFEAGRPLEALEVLDVVLDEDPEHTDAHRVRQDILRRRGRMGLLLWEAEQRLEASPESARAHYLAGRIARTDAEKERRFEAATRLAPDWFWGWLGAAFIARARDPEASVEIYRRLYEASSWHPLAAVALASAVRAAAAARGHMHDAETAEALRIYGRLRDEPSAAGIGELGIAQTRYESDEPRRGWRSLIQALRLRPFDPGVRALLERYMGRGLPPDQLRQLVDEVLVDGERADRFAAGSGNGEGARLLARLLASDGRAISARATLESAEGRAGDPMLHRAWQRSMLDTGDVPGFLAALREWVPEYLLRDERNQIRGRWVALLEGPWMWVDDPLAESDRAAELVERLMRVGMLDEAETIAEQALLLSPGGHADRLRELRDEARRELAFERAVRRTLYRGYSNPRRASLEQVLDRLRRISLQILGEDVVGDPVRFEIPFVGVLLDPFADGLCAHFARYNRHLVLGQRDGHAVEGLMVVRLSLREYEPMPEIPLRGPAWEVIGDDRQIRSLSGVYGGDLAGVALINHVVIDMDSVRDWASDIQERRQIVREDGGAMLQDTLPQRVDRLEPASVHWRLSVLSPCGDSELEEAVLDMIRWHERAHLADVFHFLPVEHNVWRVLGLVLGLGLDRVAIEAEMESRAELASLAISPHTRLVLAHIAVFLEPEAESSAHAVGFRRLAQQLGQRLADAGHEAMASRWHLLDPAVVRAEAQEMLRELW